MMFLRVLAIALSLATFTFAPAALAQTLPEPASDTVSDFADALDPAAEDRIAGLLAATRAETGVQMVVVTMPAIDTYGGAGMRLDAYAKALFNAWGVGAPDRNDGILMLVATDAQEVRIALGAGYDAVYDGRAARVLSTAVLPELREGRLAEGIEAGIASTRERLIAPFLEGRPVTLTEGFEAEAPSAAPWLAGVGAIGAALVLFFWRSKQAKKRCPRCNEPTLTRTREVIEPPSRTSSGTGIEHLTCSSCGFVDRKSFTVGKRPSSGSSRDRDRNGGSGGGTGGAGSGGGFGGGQSSGGGSSGKW